MAFKPDQHATVGYINIKYKKMLQDLQKAHKRSMKDELEYLIEEASTKHIMEKHVAEAIKKY